MKSTAEKILDAAEDLFAEKGYAATSLGDVADRVGIRSPSLYNHFKNKEALYNAVFQRLLAIFSETLLELLDRPVTRESVLDWLHKLVRVHHAHPNLARLLQHAALSGGPNSKALIDGMFKPLLDHQDPQTSADIFKLGTPDLQSWAVMTLNNIVMSYITMAPMYADLLGVDPFSEQALETQMEFIDRLARLVMGMSIDQPAGA
ncbi:MAG: TetR family transcriptional regulator [Spongiibacteraceae bacterium]|jgi:AcrR family transcriptional regulator|nr:TetR family transcriptional regulator [Spongiibacteraceae bacterium]